MRWVHSSESGTMATRLTNRRWLLRDVPRLGVLSVWAVAGFALLAYCFAGPALMRTVAMALLPPTVPAAVTGNDTGIYTGSILFVPARGELCGQWMFDNRNGALRDNGQVNCRPTSAAIKPAEVTSASRMIAIGKAFKGD
jgi:hypothetical protein